MTFDARFPHSALSVVTPPASEPVLLADAKAYARINTAADDALVTDLITGAREYLETFCRRQFMLATWLLTLDRFPIYYDWYEYSPYQNTAPYQSASQWQTQNLIRLPKPPLVSIDSIQYIDDTGVLQTLDPSQYTVDVKSTPGRLSPAFGVFWPGTQAEIDAVQIQFQAGYVSPTPLPARVRIAIKRLVAHWYQNREDVGKPMNELPLGVRNLAQSLRWGSYP